jgi:hypothetical protein
MSWEGSRSHLDGCTRHRPCCPTASAARPPGCVCTHASPVFRGLPRPRQRLDHPVANVLGDRAPEALRPVQALHDPESPDAAVLALLSDAVEPPLGGLRSHPA